jgi:hypothetical protein
MRKSLAVFLSLLLILMVTTPVALAAGKLSVTQENFYVLQRYGSVYAYVFAKIENVGDKPVQYNAGLFEVYDANGDTLNSTDYINAYGVYLQPGEYGFVSSSLEIEDAESVDVVDDYLLTVTGKSNKEDTTLRLKTESEYKSNVKTSWSTYDYMIAKVTNDQEKDVEDVNMAFVLSDAKDNILYIASQGLGSNVALTSGSSMVVRQTLDSDFVDYYAKHDLKPTKLETLAYSYPEK